MIWYCLTFIGNLSDSSKVIACDMASLHIGSASQILLSIP